MNQCCTEQLRYTLLMRAFTRSELRRHAKNMGIPRGRDKPETARNLAGANDKVSLRLNITLSVVGNPQPLKL